MNKKQVLLLAIVAIVLGAVGLRVYKRESASWTASPTGTNNLLYPNLDVNSVQKIIITENTNKITLFKDDIWKVEDRYGYPANFTEISDLVRKIADLKPIQQVKVGPSLLPRLELTPPGSGTNSGTLIQLQDKSGKELAQLLLGKKHLRKSGEDSPFDSGWPNGRFVMQGTNILNTPSKSAWVVSETFSMAEARPENWLNKDFFKVENIKSISVTPTNHAAAWKVSRDKLFDDLKMVNTQPNEEIDKTKVSSLSSVFSYPSFNDVLKPDTDNELTGLNNPWKIEIETFDDFKYNILIGKQAKDDNFYLRLTVDANIPSERIKKEDEKPEDKERLDKEFKEKTAKLKEKLEKEKQLQNWIYIVSKWTVDPVMKERSHFMAEKKPENDQNKNSNTNSPTAPNI